MTMHSSLSYGWYLKCVIAGITSTNELIIITPILGDLITDGTVVWQICNFSQSNNDNVPLGCVVPFSGNDDIPQSYMLCNGQAISRTKYNDLFNLIGTIYGEGDGSTTFNLPDLTDRFIEGSETAGADKEAGLPNITGSTGNAGNIGNYHTAIQSSGAITLTDWGNNSGVTDGSNQHGIIIGFDASLSNAIYGNSDTVQPKSLTMRYIIKVVKTPEINIIQSNSTIGIGAIQQFLQNSIPNGWLSLEAGQEVSREVYADLWTWVQENAPLISESEWQEKATNQKAVAYYSTGDESTTFRLPRLIGFAEGKTINNVGEMTSAGLPNITGEFLAADNSGFSNAVNNSTGAFYGKTEETRFASVTNGGASSIGFDASRSNSIYGNSTTVQPESFALVWCVKAYGAIVNQGSVNLESIINSLEGKANTSLSNLTDAGKSFSFPSDTYVNITLPASGQTYTVPADGYIYFSGAFTSGNYLRISAAGMGVRTPDYSGITGGFALVLPVRKNSIVAFSYNNAPNSGYTLNFHYAQGEIPTI